MLPISDRSRINSLAGVSLLLGEGKEGLYHSFVTDLSTQRGLSTGPLVSHLQSIFFAYETPDE